MTKNYAAGELGTIPVKSKYPVDFFVKLWAHDTRVSNGMAMVILY